MTTLYDAIMAGDVEYIKSLCHSSNEIHYSATIENATDGVEATISSTTRTAAVPLGSTIGVNVKPNRRWNATKIFNELFPDGRVPLNVAIASRQNAVVDLLLRLGCDANLQDSFRVDGCRRRPIHYACAAGSVELVERFVEEFDIDPEEKDAGNSPPIHHAASNGQIEVVEYLASVGCDVNLHSNSGRTALWKAASGGHREIVHILFALGASINVQNQLGETILFECVRKLQLIDILTDLIGIGADVKITDIERNTALHAAGMAGNVLAGELLATAGAVIDAANEYGNTPLHNSVMYGNTIFARFLLNRGARSDCENKAGQTPLYAAMLHTKRDTICLLNQAGYRPTNQELESFEEYEAHKNEKRTDIFAFALLLIKKPPDLISSCRVTVRRHLRLAPALGGVDGLPLPVALKNYLLLNDFL